ncbi:MAG: site-specific integrase, partial [Pseudomonadota bacterium]
MGALVRAIDASEGRAATKAALQLSLLCAQRPGELRQARWEEFDLDAAVWTIPASRMKMRRPHRVPLSDQAVKVLASLRQMTGYTDFAFPSVRTRQRCMSENTVNVALRAMGFEKGQATAHGFRATFVTLANESGLWNPDAIER